MAVNLGAYARAVAAPSCQPHLQPMARRSLAGAAIPPQLNGRIQRGDSGINAPIAIKIRKNYAAMQSGTAKIAAGNVGNICEAPALVAKDAIGLRILRIQASACHEQGEP